MQTQQLGNTGVEVSALCLGTMYFGTKNDKTTSYHLLDHYLDAGGTFLDTANIYSRWIEGFQGGESETLLGEWMKERGNRDKVFLAAKVGFDYQDVPISLRADLIEQECNRSLKRLGVETIDLYYAHKDDRDTPLEETMEAFDRLIQAGKVRYIGVSNFKGYQIQKANDIANQRGWEPFTCLQPLYNLLDRFIEWELTEVCENEGMGIIPWSPLRGGWLTGKYRRGMNELPDDGRIKKASQEGWSESWDNYNNDRTWDIIETMVSIAEEIGKEPAQVALNWVKDRPLVTSPIIGVRTMKQLESKLGSIGWELSEEHKKTLNDISEMSLPYYPYQFVEGARARR